MNKLYDMQAVSEYKQSYDQFCEWVKRHDLNLDLSNDDCDILGDEYFLCNTTRLCFSAYCAGLNQAPNPEFKNLYLASNKLIAEMLSDGGYAMESSAVTNIMNVLHDIDNGMFDESIGGSL